MILINVEKNGQRLLANRWTNLVQLKHVQQVGASAWKSWNQWGIREGTELHVIELAEFYSIY